MTPADPARNVTRHRGEVSRGDRERLLGQRGCVVWFTGLSGSGKSTLAHALERRLVSGGRLAFVLDGDNIRHGLNRDLGFSPAEREENIRRIGEVAALFAEAGVIALVAFISPYAADRARARAAAGEDRFIEVFLDTPLDVCEERDPKGLYRKARAGELAEFTGVGAPYERPERAEIVIDTARSGIEESVETVARHLAAHGYLRGTERGPA
ncbi:MAG: adenylyl-sulfate kinase [Acidobacteria bacterium]|nr:adenylyl-sulfate kinase [Acidobacteriota bacterium]